MSLVNQSQSKRLVAVHGWSGTLLGLFLYVVVLTGAVAVLAHEIGRWSAGGTRIDKPFEVALHDRLVALSGTVKPEYLEETTIYANASHALVVFFHTHGTNDSGVADDLGVQFTLDPNTLAILQRHEGFASEFPGEKESALEHFITRLHINLHAPYPWGLFLTGILGFVMLIAAISGLILHKHLLKDLFVAPRYSSALLHKKDRHVLAGSWSLPFGFVLAFTGAFFSFASAVGLPVVAMVSFGGDQEKAIEALIGVPDVVDESPAPIANIDHVLRESTEHAGADPTFVIISHWGRADAEMVVFHEPRDRAVYLSKQAFNGVTGEYKGEKPVLGQEESLGNLLYSWMHPLHFGTFAGLMSQITWFCLGLATCYVTLTGLQLWVQRREAEPVWQTLSRLIPAFGYGTAIAMVGSGIGFFIAFPQGDTAFWTAAGFLIAAALSLVAGFAIRSRDTLSRAYLISLGGGLLLLPVLRMTMGGRFWPELLISGNAMVISMDLVFIIGGVVTLVFQYRRKSGLSSDTRQASSSHFESLQAANK